MYVKITASQKWDVFETQCRPIRPTYVDDVTHWHTHTHTHLHILFPLAAFQQRPTSVYLFDTNISVQTRACFSGSKWTQFYRSRTIWHSLLLKAELEATFDDFDDDDALERSTFSAASTIRHNSIIIITSESMLGLYRLLQNGHRCITVIKKT